jgi:isocitrate dehydrogenase
MSDFKILYTKTDEAPALATYSFFPLVSSFCAGSQIKLEIKDISLAGRIISQFPAHLKDHQRQNDDLAELGKLCKTPTANIIKLPNISASIPQLTAAIQELQDQGYNVPCYPAHPANDQEREIFQKYGKILGSAVNPVLREGNSDRRVATAVKNYAKKHPHSMGAWNPESKTHVSHMTSGDFYGSEQSVILPEGTEYQIEFEDSNGQKEILKANAPLLKGEVIDAATMNAKELRSFYAKEIKDAKSSGVLFSLHLKATMMKVSDPILFGNCIKVFFAELFEKFSSELEQIAFNPNNGIGDLLKKIETLPEAKQNEIKNILDAIYAKQPELAMVNSDRGITNLHVPSDVIIDASMPAMIRTSGQMWDTLGKLKDAKAVIPDRSYSKIYQCVVDFCKTHGAFDPTTMGSVANVGLMAQKAEEYGSHDKTFEIKTDGLVRVIDSSRNALMEHKVSQGDIWRMCQTKDEPIRDWVKLAVRRARATGAPAFFWLDENRAHDRNLIQKVNEYLPEHDTSGLQIKIFAPVQAINESMDLIKAGKDVISVTGNVLRDYLTDLFPILELGTSAKMLSIVPLLADGGLFETGAGGSAPKHVQQFNDEGYLRWDSLGEFLALAVSIEDYATKTNNAKAKVLAHCLDRANTKFLENNKSPARKVGQIDNRGSHFYLAMYWAQELALQDENEELKKEFCSLAEALTSAETKIMDELIASQGKPVDVGGYFHPDDALAEAAMRPSATLNELIKVHLN